MASFVCLAIALATGIGGHVLGADEPAPPRAATAHADASSPFRQLGTMLRVPSIGGADTRGANARVGAASVGAAEPTASRALPVEIQASDAAAEGPLAVQRQPLPAAPRAQFQIQALALATRPLAPGDRIAASVSFYYCEESAGGDFPRSDGGAFCGLVRDGSRVRPGMAACDYAYLGQRFRIEGDPTARTYVCGDTGSAIHGLARDIWFMDNRTGWLWQHVVGTSAVIEILPPE
ncbi:MAG: hypothetical protein EXR63_01925 [Dehalococcoidia bacterium]|nr:hypothetical protein [Dehalococcoidia bacterium]